MSEHEKLAAEHMRATARKLLQLGVDLSLEADRLDPPIRTAETTNINTCTCDRCGDQITGLRWVGERCEATWEISGSFGRCSGVYRLDPERADEVLRTTDGRSLEVTRDLLAATQAAMDAAAEWQMSQDLEDLSDRSDEEPDLFSPDIASTYYGRCK